MVHHDVYTQTKDHFQWWCRFQMPHCVSNIDKWTDLVKKCLLRHPISKNLCTPQHAHYPARVDINAITKQKAYDLHNYVILATTAARSQISLLRHRFIKT